jgi:hypothetical protein
MTIYFCYPNQLNVGGFRVTFVSATASAISDAISNPTKVQAQHRHPFPLFFQQGGLSFRTGGVFFQVGGLFFQAWKCPA